MNKNLVSTQGRKRLTLLCVLAVIAILFATLWPFNPFPPNRVSWLPGADGIAFRDPGLVVSKTPLQVDAPQTANTHTLELFVRPHSVDSSSTILTFYVPGNPVQLRVRQWMDILIVAHDVFDKHRRPIERGIGSRPFHKAELLLLTMVFTPGSTGFYVDGKLQESYPELRYSSPGTIGTNYHREFRGQLRALGRPNPRHGHLFERAHGRRGCPAL